MCIEMRAQGDNYGVRLIGYPDDGFKRMTLEENREMNP
jgi:hypothetical protein